MATSSPEVTLAAPLSDAGALERLRLIARIAAGLHSEDGLDSMLQRAADAIAGQLGFVHVEIAVRRSEDATGPLLRIDSGADSTPAQTQPASRKSVPAAHTKLQFAAPIRQGDRLLGGLKVHSERAIDALDQMSLEIVADFLAVAIHNAQLLPQARETAVLSERARLARELHDNVTQILSSISLLTQSLTTAWQRDPLEGARRVQRLQQLAQTAFAEMRMLLRELVPAQNREPSTTESRRSRTFAGLEQLKEGALPGALQRLLEVMAPEGIQVRMDFAGYLPQRLEHEEILYRVCQEAVSNAVRHAQTPALWISAAVMNTQAVLQIADAGRGIGSEFRPGLGLSGMRTRVEQSGGHFRVTANSPCGTLIEARLPRADRG